MRPAYKNLNLMRKFERKANAAHFRGDQAMDEVLTARQDHHCRKWNERNRKIAAAGPTVNPSVNPGGGAPQTEGADDEE